MSFCWFCFVDSAELCWFCFADAVQCLSVFAGIYIYIVLVHCINFMIVFVLLIFHSALSS